MSLALVAMLCGSAIAVGQATDINPPDNDYEIREDVQVGREAAAEIERTLPLLPENGSVDGYVERVGESLVRAIPEEFRHSEFDYDFSVVNASDINAFALPGGPMYVNRGMIEAAKTEGEMAGVMAHEISHVALRHGTAQATKYGGLGVQLGALGGAVLGAIIGGDVGQVVAEGTQLAIGVHLLKFSREYETQADVLGAQIMARAGYDPLDLAHMFETIAEQSGGNIEFLSSHPNPANRSARIQEEARRLDAPRGRRNSAAFDRIQAELNAMPDAPNMAEIEKAGASRNVGENVEPPSRRYETQSAGELFSLSVPSNWRRMDGQDSILFAPAGAVGESGGNLVFTHGASVGVANAGTRDLRSATDRLMSGLMQGNPHLRRDGDYRRTTLDGREALAQRLKGRSDVTDQVEVITVYTAMLNNGALFHMVHVAPERDVRQYERAFDRMRQSVAF